MNAYAGRSSVTNLLDEYSPAVVFSPLAIPSPNFSLSNRRTIPASAELFDHFANDLPFEGLVAYGCVDYALSEV